ncbi:MAG: pirin family protein [Candidatus Heimdallarchaeota archaeon]|nr:pirin family protein [Candidatus Heimdallarchaeota archaeon]
MSIRDVQYIAESVPAIDGAGVKLRRAFGNLRGINLDPFLLLDCFGSEDPREYMAGFPWHPHRGMETVTYMLQGKVDHADSLGNRGTIKAGEIQWMTAGSGIIHQEMPQMPDDPKEVLQTLKGFQLWVNLPSSHKMMKPRYQDIKSPEIKSTKLPDGLGHVSVLAGTYDGITGPVEDVIADPVYLDISLEHEQIFTYDIQPDHTVLGYVVSGNATFDEAKRHRIGTDNLVVFTQGEKIQIETGDDPVRFLLMSGAPIKEQVAWHGPIVMNTQDEILQAYKDIQNNTFIKHEYKV